MLCFAGVGHSQPVGQVQSLSWGWWLCAGMVCRGWLCICSAGQILSMHFAITTNPILTWSVVGSYLSCLGGFWFTAIWLPASLLLLGKPTANTINKTEMLLPICSLACQNKEGEKIVPLFLDKLPPRIFLFYAPSCLPARWYLWPVLPLPFKRSRGTIHLSGETLSVLLFPPIFSPPTFFF